ncbi:MAG: dihydroneopterin aldolase [Verrucomicrobia bacterium]|nr:dihydroneopterin aldolase [Verrucomicrobiota bacterium]
MNEILVNGLRVQTRIGVPDEERAKLQDIEIDLRIGLKKNFGEMADAISETIDYAAVCEAVGELAMLRPRALVETLAEEFCEMLIGRFGADSAEVEIRKFVLPNTRSVGVRCRAAKSK